MRKLTVRSLLVIPLLLASATIGCRAQVPPAAGTPLSPELARRVEILIRNRARLSPAATLVIGPRTPADVPGYDRIAVTFTAEGQQSKPIEFLLSKDGNTLGQFTTFDISHDPKLLVSGAGRPGRGGPEGAPVEIVAFDDLECPFCARMHAELFPALTQRYGNKVRIVYRDYPIPKHPWAMHAAIDTNCVAPGDPTAYWNLVDYIHAHADELGGEEKSLSKAFDMLDQLTLDEAKRTTPARLEEVRACIKKQDDKAVTASQKSGDELGVDATPVLFINGEKLEGAYPLPDVFRVIDGALVAAGQTPPPAYVPPPPPPAPPTAAKPAG